MTSANSNRCLLLEAQFGSVQDGNFYNAADIRGETKEKKKVVLEYPNNKARDNQAIL